MEAQFVCEYRRTIKKLAEIIRKRRLIMMIILAVISIWLFLNTLELVVFFGFQWPVWAYFLLSLIYLAYALAMPEIHSFFAIRREKKSFGQDPVDIIAFGDKIEVTQGTICVTWEYSDITRVKQLKHTYLLRKGKDLAIVLDPKGFTKGTFEDFKEFLRVRCPNVDIPD